MALHRRGSTGQPPGGPDGRVVEHHRRVFYVRDNGAGIEPRHQDWTFGLFSRLDAGTEGTGVGLTLVERIVRRHDGRLWVESEGVGKGSTFCFTLGTPAGAEVPTAGRRA